MQTTLITNAQVVNEGKIFPSDILIKGEIIEKIDDNISSEHVNEVIDAKGSFVIPGIIDDQVHFREPGLTHKANIYTEARAAVAGGVTSFMEMPNTVPNALTQELLEDKYAIAAQSSLANYSFFMGASNDNIEEVLKTPSDKVCGVKVFMGSSTGNMLVDNEETLSNIFSKVPMLIATHCEDEATIRRNTAIFKEKYGEDVPVKYHPEIRSEEACYLSSSQAVALAKKHGARLHILHISTEKELSLFDNSIPLKDKKITAEACIHHLWFNDSDYEQKGTFIKWNPAVKKASDQAAIFQAILDDKIDVIATDHAPHTLEEKKNTYFKAPSGGPLIQHSLVAMMDFYHQEKISMEKIVEKMCHNPAIMFDIDRRGFIKEGNFADITIVNPNSKWEVERDNILAKCGWSPFEGHIFSSKVEHTIVSGHHVYNNGSFNETQKGQRLRFIR
ncbi:dihydroorotase [Fulvivirga ligni]|uniref:dihydroorotase n=1 Tax=Fulvivirga ligni TaxID=2904246 RepID=UPI001F45EB4F|nr:dihydroorotase [Fulvivirga ligni]UII21914.1 dihydroorotase [Fulvivirga ligni]